MILQHSINRRVFLAGGVVAAAMAYLTWSGFAQTMVYYVTVAELVAKGDAAYDRPVRVGGRVVDGTMKHDAAAGALAFQMTDGTGTLPVAYRGVKPDLLGYSAQGAYQDVVVEGKLGRDGTLRATQLIVKHGPEFEAKP
ncbi:MAG TPA: cytochrome c maturation protein CcmE [Chloroflexota bacterium]|nr:cytochrome c maturation protein CcmE [Chloroflexota bacterium]